MDSVKSNPERHSLLYQENTIIVPGGRFRESYYWDSYWINKGLLVSGMTTTANGVVNNLLTQVKTYGFVPNGGRDYYLNRSQPPFLSDMVVDLYNSNSTFLTQDVLDTLNTEY